MKRKDTKRNFEGGKEDVLDELVGLTYTCVDIQRIEDHVNLSVTCSENLLFSGLLRLQFYVISTC